MPKREAIYGKLHTNYNLHTTRTGRSCIAKGTMIEVFDGDVLFQKPIEDVREGDHVLCYDDKCQPVKRKVLWAGKTGDRSVVGVNWSCGLEKGSVLMTPEHRIRLKDGLYMEAQRIQQLLEENEDD